MGNENAVKEIGKQIKKILIILALGGALGLALLMLVYAIPTERMIYNARASVELIEDLGVNPQLISGYQATTLDTYTDTWMLRIAFYNGEESLLQKSLNNYNYGYGDGRSNSICESVVAYLNGMEGYQRYSYARYWHGYLVFLKPLLFFFDYGDIMGILKFVQLFLVVFCCVLLERNKLTKCIPAFLAACICVEFHTIGLSMQYSGVFVTALLSSIWILKRDDGEFQDLSVDFVFLVTGMCTSFLDFLTYPVFTLGIPLTMMLLRRSVFGWKWRLPLSALLDSFYWGLGYGGMWSMKWILCTIFTGENMIADGIHSVLYRSGADVMGKDVSYLEVLWENIRMICKYPYVLAILGVIIYILLNKPHFHKIEKEVLIAWLFVVCIPFLWYAVSKNHSYIHAFMAYRDLGVSVFAGLCFLTQLKKE